MIDLSSTIASTESGVITTLDQTLISETVGSSWVDPAYDDAGNMITGPLGTTPTTKLHFVFDAWNRMVTVKAHSSGSPGSTIASYTYDGRNWRIEKTIGGSTYHGYYNNNWQYLETRIGSSTSSSGQVVWDLRYIDSPLALLGGANPLYYTNDANFNVTALINGGTGAVSERSQYDPYGNVQFYTAAWATTSSSAADNPFLYCGYTFDGESGLYLARNRYLNVALGTWEKRDPLGGHPYYSVEPRRSQRDATRNPCGSNLTLYVDNNPLALTDSSGLKPGTATTQPGPGFLSNGKGYFEILLRPDPINSKNIPKDKPESPKYNALNSDVQIKFHIDAFVMKTTCCTEIRLIQLADTRGDGVKSEPWHIDDKGSGAPPYYAIQDYWLAAGGNLNSQLGFAQMTDSPGKDGSKSLIQSFETVAVCAAGREKGWVYGTLYWGHDLKGDPSGYAKRWVSNTGPIAFTATGQTGTGTIKQGPESSQNYVFAPPLHEKLTPGPVSKNFWALAGGKF